MSDAQITKSEVKAAPDDFVVTEASRFILKAVNADFDGSGSAATWLPALEIISDSGHVIARSADQNVSVAAGGSAETSWFPGVKRASAASSGGGSLTWATSTGTITLNSGASTSADSVQTAVATNDSAHFDLSADELRIKQDGLYICFFLVYCQNSIAAGNRYELIGEFDTAGSASSYLRVGGTFANEVLAFSGGHTGVRLDQIWYANIKSADLNVGLYTHVVTITAAGATMAGTSNIGILRLSDPISGSIS